MPMSQKKIKNLILASIVIIAILSISIYLYSKRDNDEPFLSSDWISVKKPVFYYHFTKNGSKYTREIYDCNGDFASDKDNGKLEGTTLTFDGTNYLKNIYIYKNGFIYVKNIARDGTIDYFAPLKKVKHGYKK